MGSVIVLGSIGGDVVATTDRHPRPGETVMGAAVEYFPGGKGANQAVAAAAAGSTTRMVGRIGADAPGSAQLAFLGARGVDTGAVRVVEAAATQTAIIVVDSAGENTIVVIPGASGLVDQSDVSTLRVQTGDVVVSQFETPQEAIVAAFERARGQGATTVLNCAPAVAPRVGLLDLVDVVVVNESEVASLSGRPLDSASTLDQFVEAAHVLRASAAQVVVITLGRRGALAVKGADVVVVEGRQVDVVDTTGAGDCFVGYLAAGLARGDDLRTSMALANSAASLCVQRAGAGTSIPLMDEVETASSR